MNNLKLIVLIFVLSFLSSSYLFAQDGVLDLTFNTTGIATTSFGSGYDFGKSVAIQSDGKIVVAGSTSSGTKTDFAVVRYNSNGILDTGFGTGGKVTTAIGTHNDAGYSVGIQSDGKIVVSGVSSNGNNNDIAVVRYNTDGTLDATFGTGGKVITVINATYDDTSYGIAIQSDGKIVVAGYTRIGSNYEFAVVRYNSIGTLDNTFDSDGIATTNFGLVQASANSVALQSDGKIVLAGYAGINKDFAVARFNSNGSLDNSFDGDGKVTTSIGSASDVANSVAIQADGKIIAAGYARIGNTDDFALVRYNTDGSLDTGFNSVGKLTTAIGTGTDWTYDIAIQSDGKILVAGFASMGLNNIAVVRYNTNGSLDTTFDTDGKVTTSTGTSGCDGISLAIQSDGKIVVAGDSFVGSNDADFAVVRYANSLPQYTVITSSNPAIGGTTSGDGTFNSGSSVTVTATANNGYTFTNWSENGTVVSSSSAYTFSITGNRTLVANFTLNTVQGNSCITWDLLASTAVTSTSGNISGQPEIISGGSAPAMSVFSPYIANGQKLGVMGGWLPGNIDNSRYIEFKVAPISGNSLNVTNVSFNYGDNPQAANFNILKSQVFYSVDGTNWTQLGSTLSYLNTSLSSFTANISGGVQVPNGQSFSMRIYPYSPSGSIAGTVSFAIHNTVVICGTTASDPALATVKPGGPDQVCQSANPSAITLSGASVGGSATSGAWSITSGGGTLSTTAQTATPAAVTYTPAANYSGTVSLKLTTNSTPPISATRTITINALPPAPAAITGTFSVCVGSTTQLADATSGGIWTSGSPGVAIVNASTGLVTGVSAGTALITYTTGGAVVLCTNSVTQTVTVNASPTITGTTPASRCGTGTVTLGATASAGTISWYAASTGGSPLGTGTSFTSPVLTSTTTYYVDATSGGCTTSIRTAVTATVNALPVVSAPASVAVGSTITLSPTTGGTWTSSNQLVATVTNAGVVTGVSTGSATFTFTNTVTGCSATTSSVAVGSDCIFLSNTDFEIPVVGPAVPGYYAQGFIQTPEVNVPSWHTTASDGKIEIWDGRPTAMNITAASGNQFAELNCTQLGTLYQNFTSIANQQVVIKFAHRGRYAGLDKMEVQIGPSGGTYVTIGTFYDNLAGGWSHYSIPYTLPTGGLYQIRFASIYSNGGDVVTPGGNFLDEIKIECLKPNDATVKPGGPDVICQSASPTAITLSGASVGGSATTGAWSITLGGGTLSSTAQTASPASVTYTPAANYSGTVILKLTTNSTPPISATRTITINALPPAPAAITGTFTVCVGSTTQLADATSGGIWTSGSPGVATVNASTGLVTGVSAGTALITYTTGGAVVLCTNSVTQTVTVNASPTITGTTPASRCGTGTVTLGATASAGTINWYAAATGGTSLGTGTSFITPVISTTTTYYADATSGGCTTSIRTAVSATVNALPVVSAPVSISAGSTVSLSPNTGGTWTSSNQLVATVSASGLVTGVAAGTVTFTFTNTTTGCSAHTTSMAVTTAGNKPCIYLSNTGFEQFSGATPPTGYYWFPQANIPFWNTTATDGKIEIWHSGYGSVPAHSGNYFAEINATQNATLYQTFTATALQTVMASFWHRGRYAGVDKMKVWIGPDPLGPFTDLGTYSDNNSAWNLYSTASYTIPTTGTYRIKFESISSNNGTGPLDGGNFLDDINVTCPSSICGIKYNDLNGDGQKQATEPVLPNWEITLTGPLSMTVTTGADGSYCFNNLPAGSYTVQETQQSGWVQTAPAAPGNYSVNIIEGQNVIGKDFGNRQLTNPSCTDFEDGTNAGWQLTNSLSSIITDGTNHYIQTTDQSGASSLFNNSKPLTGDWTDLLANGCGSLCFDVNFLYAGNPYGGVNPPSTVTSYISISGNGFSAAFIITNPILAGSGWHSYCAPLANLNLDGTLPSNADGYWVMGTGSNSDWNSLLSNVTQIRLPVDPSSYQGEKFGYDNICLKNTGDCAVPCCDKVTVVPVLDANGKATCSAKITATCEVRSIEVTVANGTLSSVNWNCPTAIPTGYIGLSAYTFVPGSCIPELTTSVNAITSGIVTITYDITFSSGEKCRKTIEVNCGATCCDQVKVERVLDAAGKASCSAKITTNCEVKSIAVTVTNGTLSSVNWNCTTAIPTGYTGLSTYTFAPGSCIPEMTIGVDAIASGTVTITWDITFANGEKCQKKVDLDCSVPLCCDKVKVEPVVDATGMASCCAKITADCEVKSISVIVSNGTLSSASWNCPTTIPTGYVGQTAYTFAPGNCTPVMTTCVDAIKSGMVTITYDIVFANGEKCQKSVRLDCAVASECVTPPTGMVLWLPGDENSFDISGLNNHGTLSGAATYSTGKVAAAFRAGKYLDYISVPDNSSLNFGTGNFSVDAWIRTTDNIHFISIADKSVSVGNNMIGYRLFVIQGKLSFQMGDGSAPLSQWVPTVPIADGAWHFVAVTIDRKATDGGKLYIDGSLALAFDPTSKPGSISNTIPMTLLGNNMVNLTASDHYTFYLDEVELFNRTITGAEIASIYNAGSAGKCKLGSICGTKFNDLNGNGRRDKDEPGIPEWKIMIGGIADLTTYTDQDGNYCFYNLEPGEYKIGEEVRAGWQQIIPAAPGTYTINLPAGQNLTGLDFGNRLIPQTGSICGSKFNDLNGNGKRDEGEPGIGDWTILLGGGATELKVTTDKNGDFCFDNLKPGEYKLGEENRVGWFQMKPSGGSYNLILAAGQKLEGYEFGNMLDSKPASVCGIKFNDLNGNGTQELNEPGLPNWTISLTGSATMTAVTDRKGNYCFTGLKPGTYTVSEVNQPLWNQTSPHPTGNYTVTLTASQYLENLNFGNQHEQECITPPILMLGWWPGDNNANDITLNGNYGTLVNGATFAPGKVDKAFSLMGSTDYVNIPDRPQLNPGNGDFTIDAWIQTSEATGTFAILDKRGYDANQNVSGYGLFVVDGHLQLKLSDSAGNGLAAALYNDNTTMIADGQWHFVAATVEQGSNHRVKLFIDGIFVNESSWGLSNLNYSNTVALRIGEAYFSNYSNNSPADHYHNFQGLIDEVEFMYGARSEAELAGIYNAGSAGKCKPAIQLGSICGSKFNDLNGNGIKDSRGDGEPGLANWTIKLTGAATLTTTTDANGNFCFNNLAPGQYTIAEVNQTGWIQTAPLNPNTFIVTLEPGVHIEVLNFGNKIDPTFGCVTPPSGMVLWLPGDGHTRDISGLNNHGTLEGGASYLSGKVDQAFSFSNHYDEISIPNSASINFGESNFSIDAWVKTTDNINEVGIVMKTVFASAYTNTGSVLYSWQIGYGLRIHQGKLSFIMGDNSSLPFMNFDAPTTAGLITDGKWHFVAVTIDRKNSSGGKLYLDGNLVLTFDPTSRSGSLTYSNDLRIGYHHPNTFNNQIDEVELFNRALTGAEIASIYNAGSSGKCKLGSICGMKFNDLNGNGKKDEGEPGISGWLINLSGTANLSIRTEKDGSYCFTNLNPGDYQIGEEVRDGWTQVTPINQGKYSVNLAAGKNINGLNFGNKLQNSTSCVEPPSGMVAWWAFDEISGTTATDFAGYNNSGTLNKGPLPVPAKVLKGLQFDGIDDYVKVPNQPEIEFGTGDFSFDAWIQTNQASGIKSLIDKRDLTGYAFYLDNGKLCLQMRDGSGTNTNYVSPLFVADDKWHHIAVTVSRTNKNGIHFYLDGVETQFGDPTLRSGSLNNSAPLVIGCDAYYNSGPYFKGILDEIELFNRVITKAEINSIFNAGSSGKCKLGSICGTKYNDLNGDGRRDDRESGIPEWQIMLDGTARLTAITDKDGNYCFTNLLPGDYKILEELRPEWQQKAPAEGYYGVNLSSGQNIKGKDFGNMLNAQLGSICGVKYNDLNGNGIRDKEEPGIPDWTILIGGTADFTVQTDKNGEFCLTNLKPGIYKIGEQLRDGWIQTAPSSHYFTIELRERQHVTNLEFGNTLDPKTGSICGMKFNDLNGNGTMDNGEQGIPDWTISLSGPTNLTIQTDKSGNYCFTRLPAGIYTIGEGSRVSWYQTAPASGTYSITLKPGESIVRMNFGNRIDPCYIDKKSWTPLGSGLNNWTETLAVLNGKLFAGGAFTSAGGVPANRIARWDGTNWSALGTGINVGWVASMAVKGSTLYAGGEFLSAGGMPSTYAIAKWDETGSTWSSLGTGTNSWVYALTVIDQQVYAKGIFTAAGGSSANNIARWNGTNWLPLGSGINNSGFESSLTSIGSTLYAGGYFNSAGGVSANSVAKWDEANNSWSPLGSGVNGGVRTLIGMGGELYAAGGFTSAGGVSANRIAKWNGSTWAPLGSGTNGPVFALAVIGSDLYVGGDFTTAGGITVNGIAKWDGTNWSSLGTGMGGPPGNNSYVNALAVIGSDLYAAGYFNSADGVSVHNIAKYSCGVPTSVGEVTIQQPYNLEQNYPNPFISTSTIGYSVPQTSQVKISVHDLYGKEIKVLVNEEKDPGRHEIVFDRKDFASGIYIYTLKTEGFTQSKKMIILK